MKILKHLIISAAICLALFFGFKAILPNDTYALGVLPDNLKSKIQELILDEYRFSHEEVSDKEMLIRLDSIIDVIALENSIEKDFEVYVFENTEKNAFAMPDGGIIITSALLDLSESDGEIAGVIAHEMAHVVLNHVDRRVLFTTGLNISIATLSGASGEMIKVLLDILANSGFSRSEESAADMQAVDYLMKANMNPLEFASMLEKLDKESISESFEWVNSHPLIKKRVKAIEKKVKTIEKKEIEL